MMYGLFFPSPTLYALGKYPLRTHPCTVVGWTCKRLATSAVDSVLSTLPLSVCLYVHKVQ